MDTFDIELHIHRALVALADLAGCAGLKIEDELRTLAEKSAPGPSGRA